jgi:hypothetical protein
MAVTTNQATVCRYQPVITLPLRRGGKTGTFNVLDYYGTVANYIPSISAAPSKKIFANTSIKALPALAQR